MQLNVELLQNAVAEHAAIRRRQRLQPVGGPGDKIFPPTYPPSDAMKRHLGEKKAPPRHIFECRQLNGVKVNCALVDSVQSQANRLEECLLQAVAEEVPIPHVAVDFSGTGLDGITRITSLDAPHRVYDAILRDSLLDGQPFMESAVGNRLAKVKADDATALLEVSPTALLFGAWHSTGEGGGLGAKFARCLVSEIIAVDVPAIAVPVSDRRNEEEVQTAAQRAGSRIDPLGISKNINIYHCANNEKDWTIFEEEAARDKNGKPRLYTRKKGDNAGKASVINHGNIAPSVQPLGVTCKYAEHTFVLSFAALRRLRFGGGARDAAGRTLLAALGLMALREQDARGYALRSRCDLVCDSQAPLELVSADGRSQPVEIDRAAARALYQTAFERAQQAGFALSADPLRLVPQDKLVEIVRRSQAHALAGEGGEEDGGGDTP